MQTEPRYELAVIHELLVQGFEDVCFPSFVDAYGQPARLMFPRYGFVAFDVADPAWRAIPHTPRLVRLFGSSPEHPTPLPVGEVERLLRAVGDDGFIDARTRPIEPGDEVRLLGGPFADHVGLCRMSDEERVTVLLTLFGRDVPVAAPLGSVERVTPRA